MVASGRTWREIGWLLVGLPLGLLWGIWVVVMYSLSLGLVVIWVGVPLLAVTQETLRWIGASERVVINAMLPVHIGRPETRRHGSATGWLASLEWMGLMVRDAHAWRVGAWSAVRLVTGPVGFVLAVAAVVAPVAAVGTFVMAILFVFGPVRVTLTNDQVLSGSDWWWTLPASVLVAVTLVPALWWVVRGFTAAHTAMARWALGPCAAEQITVATQRAELAEEQVRIDQELHDSIGHMITMNIIQAGAGAHVFDSDPEFARQALKNIEERGRAAMGELDRIISTIRGEGPETRAPLPGLADLRRLVEESCAAGMEVDAVIEPPHASDAVGRAAFTVVREALTNAARHAPGAPVSVTVSADGDALALLVENGAPAGPSAPSARSATGGGRGLAGIRDRVTLLGGRASAGAVGKGFAVRALLPLGASLSPASAGDQSPWADLRERVAP